MSLFQVIVVERLDFCVPFNVKYQAKVSCSFLFVKGHQRAPNEKLVVFKREGERDNANFPYAKPWKKFRGP